MKVKKAKDLGLTEDANLKRELEGYRKQLSSSYLTDREIVNVSDVMKQDLEFFKKFFWGCLEEGIYLAPSPYETGFISLAHTEADLDDTLAVFSQVLAKI